MTNLANLAPSQTYGDLLTIPNNNQGLNLVLTPLQDGLGNNSPMSLATNAVSFDRTGGQTFRLDNTAVTALSVDINSMASPNPIALGTGSLTVPLGTTFQRPAPLNGMMRYNITLNRFEVVQNGIWIALSTGADVVGPGASTDNALVRWNGVTGTLTKDSIVILDDAGVLTGLATIGDLSNLDIVAGTLTITSLDTRFETGISIRNNNDVKFWNAGDTQFTSLEAGNPPVTTTYILPLNPPPAVGYFLTCDPVTKQMSWAIPA